LLDESGMREKNTTPEGGDRECADKNTKKKKKKKIKRLERSTRGFLHNGAARCLNRATPLRKRS